MQEPQEARFQSLGQEDPLDEDMATHSSTLAWEIPWPEEPGGLQSIGSQWVRHDLSTKQLKETIQMNASTIVYFVCSIPTPTFQNKSCMFANT